MSAAPAPRSAALAEPDAEELETRGGVAAEVIHLPDLSQPARRGGVRRASPNPRTAYFRFRLPPARKASIVAAAKAARMTVTAYILSHLPDAKEAPQRRREAVADPHVLVRMLGELGKIGSNYNQLARRKNMTGEEPEPDAMRRIAADIQEMRCGLLKALGRAG
jgi:hypothetical protein